MSAMERETPGYVNTWNIFKRFWPLLVGILLVVGLVVGYRMTQKAGKESEKA